MTAQSNLRLVVDDGQSPPRTATLELPETGARQLHVHLHLSGTSPSALAPAIGLSDFSGVPGRPRGKLLRRSAIVLSCLFLALVFFEVGARSGQARAEAEARAASLAQSRPQDDAATSPGTLGSPADQMAAIRRQLQAAPEILSPLAPPGAPQAASPFGLHP